MTAIGTIVDGKYEILKIIGKGGMSIVYLAMDIRLNKQWAIKEIRKNDNDQKTNVVIKGLLTEANLMKRLDHPSLPRIVDIIDTGYTLYIVMDYIEGESLDKILKAHGAQPQERVIDWAKQLCATLGYLHSQTPPIIYRDMKPSNIMLKPEGNTLKLFDFGIAKEYKEDKKGDTTLLGTRGYAAPEQFDRDRQSDARTDIYCLGATLYHLVTGHSPTEPPYEILPIRTWNPNLSGGLERIIMKCTRVNPDERYQNCEELMYALEHYQEIDDAYILAQKKKKNVFVALLTLGILLLSIGTGSRMGAVSVNNNTYDNLINVEGATAYEDKISRYKEAAAIYPGDIRAYLNMLEAYGVEEKFSREQNDEFLALYNANKEELAKNRGDFAELNYRIGMMYFNYYVREDGTYSFSERVQKAYSFFQAVSEGADGSFANQTTADCYYQICSFYKKYILSSITIEEASRENFEELLAGVEANIESLKTAGAHDQLSFYNGVFMLLYDQRAVMAQVGVEQEQVLTLLSVAYENARALTVTKEESQKLQEEIINHYEEYRAAITRSYGKNVTEQS